MSNILQSWCLIKESLYIKIIVLFERQNFHHTLIAPSQSPCFLSLTLLSCLHIRELVNYFLLTWQDLRGKARRSFCLCENLEPALHSFKWWYFHTVIQVKKTRRVSSLAFLLSLLPFLITQSRSCWRQACEWLDTCVCVYLCASLFGYVCMFGLEVCDPCLMFFLPSSFNPVFPKGKTFLLPWKEWSQ